MCFLRFYDLYYSGFGFIRSDFKVLKRFFQPVQKDGSFKKPNLSSSSSPTPAVDGETKTPVVVEDEENKSQKKEPTKLLTWDANNFLLHVKNNWPEFTKFIDDIDPDVITIQEVKMPAAGAKGAPKNPRELKDDNNSSRKEKLVQNWDV
ncbi:DNA-(apurinic or apyrimidinic site) endonuclease-like [Helianthus annuus]|uniref:DNA-(apurinic or apyrimidinic site) endonuclease-like n=1 Tax=Helianthus annuus TaxID=4232 RepID=UPI001652D9E0|nr:DNA-(apurinic or apyrimidinic site) endonuclease-like [Helianthus annuus]